MVLIVGLFAATGYGTESAEIERLRAENARLQTRVTTLEAELARARRASSALTERAETVVHEAQTNGLRLVHTDPMPVRTDSGVRSRHWLTFRSQPGAAAEAAVEFIIDTASSDGAYRSAEQLQLSIDGSTAAFPVTSYKGTVEVFESFDSRAIVVWTVDFESDPEDSVTVAATLRSGIGAGVEGMERDLQSREG